MRRPAAPSTGAPACVAVACSGGRDSLCLLHATARAARGSGVQVLALHVHHGLWPQADDWWRQVQRRCAAWRRRGWPVQAHLHRLTDAPAPGDSIEAWARQQRYAALAAMAKQHQASVVLLAHHRQDQAETVLLQLLRGAGAAGLAAMPARFQRHDMAFERPWLNRPAEAIAAYAWRHRLTGVQDPSNADPRHARARVRHDLLPVLQASFPDAPAALAHAAQRAALEAAALSETAAADLATCQAGDGALDTAAWAALPPGRRALALQAWLRESAGNGVPDALWWRLLDELPGRRGAARWPAAPDAELRLYRGRLRWLPRAADLAAIAAPVPPAPAPLGFRGPGRYGVPGGGHLCVSPTTGPGLTTADLQAAQWRPRQGGEQFQASAGGLPRSLKKAFQAAGVPADGRSSWLLADGDRVLWVPGLGPDARALRRDGGARFTLSDA
jgi:tRNA(Ile)-lysidine synthase